MTNSYASCARAGCPRTVLAWLDGQYCSLDCARQARSERKTGVVRLDTVKPAAGPARVAADRSQLTRTENHHALRRLDRTLELEPQPLPVPGPVMTPALLAAKADAEAHGFTVDRAAASERGWLTRLLDRIFG